MWQTRKEGVLPKSIMVVGQGTYDFKEYLKKHFDAIRYVDLVFNGGTVEKAAWVLPCAGETEATGTLAAFVTDLGVDVTEKNLDENDDDDDDDDDDDNDDGNNLIEGHAEEGDDD